MNQLLKTTILCITLFLSMGCTNNEDQKEVSKKDAVIEELINSIPLSPGKYHHKVMVLGSFHFDRGRDGSDVISKNHLDITNEINQDEIQSIVDNIIKIFKPTIVAVEWNPKNQSVI